MTPRTDPPRLVSSGEVPASLREALREARADAPSPSEVSAIAAGLGSVLGPSAGGSSGPTAAGGGLGAGKLAAILGAATLVVGGFVWSAKTTSVPPAPRVSGETSMPTEAVPEAIEVVAPPVEEVQPVGGGEAEAVGEAAESAPEPSRRRASPAKESVRAPASGASSAEASKPSEAALLDAARRALAKDPERTLAYASRHRALYPQGMLAQEREVLVVEALRKLGRASEAKQHDDEFRSRYPSSIHGGELPVPGAAGNKN